MFDKTAKKQVDALLGEKRKKVKPIDVESFLHPSDKAALKALKAIPFFDTLCSKFISIYEENLMNVLDMSSKIRISEKQLPRIYAMLVDVCDRLSIEVPNLYLEMDRSPNAYTYGNTKVSITITSGLIECLNEYEIYAVLAHECGHIACKHVLYSTIARFLLKGTELTADLLTSGPLASLISAPLKLAFLRWVRCSELSADRVAVECCKTAEPVVSSFMRLAGATTTLEEDIDRDEFINQCANYQKITEESKISKFFEVYMTLDQEHPLLAVRAHEAIEWEKQNQQ